MQKIHNLAFQEENHRGMHILIFTQLTRYRSCQWKEVSCFQFLVHDVHFSIVRQYFVEIRKKWLTKQCVLYKIDKQHIWSILYKINGRILKLILISYKNFR